jgi:EmrB/QacA subfamily drug resistance transporter
MLIVGLVAFLGASFAAAYATSTATLVGARALMGFGSAIMTPVATAVLPVLFGPRERARAVAVMAAALGLGVPLGPIVGGYLLDHFWWGSIFLVNVPVAIVGLVAVIFLVPESRDPRSRPVDVLGGLLSTAGLTALVYGVIAAPRRGWSDALVGVTIAAGLALLAAFVGWERRCRHPMIDLGLFGRPRFLWGTLSATIAGFALFGLLFTLPQFFQAVQGRDAFETGLRLVPLMAGLVVAAAGSDRVLARVGAKIPVTAGLAIIAVGLGLGASTRLADPYGWTAAWLAVVGFGTGLAMAPAMDAVLGELPVEQAGSGTALTMTLRQVGAALGIALLGSLLSSVYSGQLDVTGLPGPAAHAARDSVPGAMAVAAQLHSSALAAQAGAAYLHSMNVVLAVCATVAVLGAVGVALALPARSAQPAPESGHELSRVA